MDFGFTPEQEALRKEFIRFFEVEMKHAPSGWQGGVEDHLISDENWAFHTRMARRIGERGWLTLAWPEEYGGLNASPVEQMILNETAGYYKSPGLDMISVKLLGPIIYKMGSEKHKKEHLKPIAEGKRFWCQGWSEPDAGSDLAVLTTTGIREGDVYVVNGQKVWTTGGHRADWMLLLVRTDPDAKRSKGLSLLLVDMQTAGISVMPISMMNGNHSLNEIFLKDVRIPVADRIGDENKGWDVVKTISNFERSGALPVNYMERRLEELIDFCKKEQSDLTNSSMVRHMLASLAVDIQVAKALTYRVASLHTSGEIMNSGAHTSTARVFTSELNQRLVNTGCRILGQVCQVKQGSRWAALKGAFERDYQLCMGRNIATGTSEIQRNIIAWTALGLPRK